MHVRRQVVRHVVPLLHPRLEVVRVPWEETLNGLSGGRFGVVCFPALNGLRCTPAWGLGTCEEANVSKHTASGTSSLQVFKCLWNHPTAAFISTRGDTDEPTRESPNPRIYARFLTPAFIPPLALRAVDVEGDVAS